MNLEQRVWDWLQTNGPAWPHTIALGLGIGEGQAHRAVIEMANAGHLNRTTSGYEPVRIVRRHDGDNGPMAGGI